MLPGRGAGAAAIASANGGDKRRWTAFRTTCATRGRTCGCARARSSSPSGSRSSRPTGWVASAISSQVNAVNQTLGDAPGQVNDDAYGAGWLVRVEPNDLTDAENLMDAAQYEAYVTGGGE